MFKFEGGGERHQYIWHRLCINIVESFHFPSVYRPPPILSSDHHGRPTTLGASLAITAITYARTHQLVDRYDAPHVLPFTAPSAARPLRHIRRDQSVGPAPQFWTDRDRV